jgi:hypothetical protein
VAELFAILMSWAASISGTPMPATMPPVVWVEKEWLYQVVCQGKPCRAMGLHRQGTIYLDKRLDPANQIYHASVVVHEFDHYLRWQTGAYKSSYDACRDAIEEERHAFGVQQEFLTRHGVYQPVGLSMHFTGCR